ncbi:MAG: hypothetical protein ACOC3T_01255 [Bacteroidota bacterium]
MKNKLPAHLLSALVLLLVTTGFDYDEPFISTEFDPILMDRQSLNESVFFQTSRQVENPGKIYLYNHLILINEKYEGVHIIDNSNPAEPTNLGFISIPGCIDMAVQNGVLFADNAVDLVAVDIINVPEITIRDREVNIFPEHTPPDLDYIPSEFSSRNRPENTVIVGWK